MIQTWEGGAGEGGGSSEEIVEVAHMFIIPWYAVTNKNVIS